MIAKRIGIIGAGKMGEAILNGLLSSHSFSTEQVLATEVSPERSKYIRATYGISCGDGVEELVNASDLIIIAVKPEVVESVVMEVGKTIGKKPLVSIAAGVTIEFISRHLPKGVPVFRAMPNIAAYVRAATIAIAVANGIAGKSRSRRMVDETLGILGKVVFVDERLMDAITGLVGSGPAYIYTIIDALADAGVRLGIPKDLSIILAAQTVRGASMMVLETGKHPALLKDEVASPGGTTIEGLVVLERGSLRGLLIEAVTSAASRAKSLRS